MGRAYCMYIQSLSDNHSVTPAVVGLPYSAETAETAINSLNRIKRERARPGERTFLPALGFFGGCAPLCLLPVTLRNSQPTRTHN